MYSALNLIKKAIDPSVLAGGVGLLGGGAIGGLTGYLKNDPLESKDDRNKRILGDMALGGGLGTAAGIGTSMAAGNFPGLSGSAASSFQQAHPLISSLGSLTKGESSIPLATSFANLLSGIPSGKYIADSLSYGGAAGGVHALGREVKDAWDLGKIKSLGQGASSLVRGAWGGAPVNPSALTPAESFTRAAAGGSGSSLTKVMDALRQHSNDGVLPKDIQKTLFGQGGVVEKLRANGSHPGLTDEFLNSVQNSFTHRINPATAGLGVADATQHLPSIGRNLLNKLTESRGGASPYRTGLGVALAELLAQPGADLVANGLQSRVQLH